MPYFSNFKKMVRISLFYTLESTVSQFRVFCLNILCAAAAAAVPSSLRRCCCCCCCCLFFVVLSLLKKWYFWCYKKNIYTYPQSTRLLFFFFTTNSHTHDYAFFCIFLSHTHTSNSPNCIYTRDLSTTTTCTTYILTSPKSEERPVCSGLACKHQK